MSDEKKNGTLTPQKQEAIRNIQRAPEVYTIASACTRMPYVICDPDTFDDEVLVYMKLEDAQNAAKALAAKKEPVSLVKVENKQLLRFFSNLYAMGVNCVVIGQGLESEISLQLSEIVHRADTEEFPEGKIRVENPELVLTALYLMQKTQRLHQGEGESEVKQLQEEVMAHFSRGHYIVAFEAEKGVPLLKDKKEDSYQPVFTDVLEFQKFNRENRFRTAVIPAEKIPDLLAPETKGVVINPMSVNLQLQIHKKKRE